MAPPSRVDRRRALLSSIDARRKLRIVKERSWEQKAHDCLACNAGVHDPGYNDDGVCECRCCGRDMTDQGFPWLKTK